MLHPSIFSRLDIIENGKFRKMRYSNPDMSYYNTSGQSKDDLAGDSVLCEGENWRVLR
jgi:hypothetical protein